MWCKSSVTHKRNKPLNWFSPFANLRKNVSRRYFLCRRRRRRFYWWWLARRNKKREEEKKKKQWAISSVCVDCTEWLEKKKKERSNQPTQKSLFFPSLFLLDDIIHTGPHFPFFVLCVVLLIWRCQFVCGLPLSKTKGIYFLYKFFWGGFLVVASSYLIRCTHNHVSF